MTSIVMSVAASIDLNTLDSLSRTCRQIRQGLLQYRTMLLVSTMHCINEQIPVDPEDTFRYRARASNWYYMQDLARSSYNGKSGQCARDLVAGCRRCGIVVCRVSLNHKWIIFSSRRPLTGFLELCYQTPCTYRHTRPSPASLRAMRGSTSRLARQTAARARDSD
jgi:hypothetical protein